MQNTRYLMVQFGKLHCEFDLSNCWSVTLISHNAAVKQWRWPGPTNPDTPLPDDWVAIPESQSSTLLTAQHVWAICAVDDEGIPLGSPFVEAL